MQNIIIKKVNSLEDDICSVFDHFANDIQLAERKLIVIKPNWVMPREEVTTSKEVFVSVVKEIKKRSKARIVVVEGSGYEFDTKKTFEILGIYELCKSLSVELINSRAEASEPIEIGGKVLKRVNAPAIIKEADLIINLPKLKTHVLTDISFSMKNLYGLISKDDRHFGHLHGLPQSIVDLAVYCNKKTFSIIDGLTAVVGQGPAFGDIIKPNLIMAGTDLFSLDYAVCQMCNIDPNKVYQLKLADKMGLIPAEAKSYQPEIKINDFRKIETGNIYKFLYRMVYLLDSLLRVIIKKDLVLELVTRLGTRIVINKKEAQPFKEALIAICPVNAIKNNLEVDFLTCRRVRCLRCWEKFPQAVTIKGFSKPKNMSSD